jgi:uncharacterized protein
MLFNQECFSFKIWLQNNQIIKVMKNYDFSWNQLGDIKIGRPNLGMNTSVEVYRLMQYTMRAVLNQKLGTEETNQILANAGRLAGVEFCKNKLDISLPLNKFTAQLHEKLLEHAIGILKVEKIDMENMDFIVTVSEDLDCSGLPVTGYTVCEYDEGFLEGIFNTYTKKELAVKEIDCWSTGDSTCRFIIRLK